MSHGLYLPFRDGLSEDEERLRELRAYLLVLPESTVFTHLTAAWLMNWRLPHLPEQIPVFAAVDIGDEAPRRHGLICSRLVPDRGPPAKRRGLPVDAPEEILLRAARDLGVLDLVILVDSALANGDLDPARMDALLASRRPGVRVLRSAYELANPRSESAGETVLRVFHEAIGVAVQAQVDLFDAVGTLIGRADLMVTGTTAVHEYDGAYHRDQRQHRRDLRRERALAGTPYVRRGFVLDDLLNHPGVVMHEIDRALGRPHHPSRLERWRRIVDNSLYSEKGRARVMNRWRRQNGIIDWAKTT
ncbi:hypothetical protein [Nocardioides dongkuii]|uniref:hypothetical protein n=1 Tax=Nocardioides dongkuii TaxID=2760089 RepID=UPI0015FAF577|nr:hypothetical protein [Nocardioides dongkuii]